MDQPDHDGNVPRTGRFFRLVCFVTLSTVGMASIATAILAKPLADRYADQDVLRTQRRRIEQLSRLHTQQAQLLAHAQTPAIIERQAINRLNYVPTEPDINPTIPLPALWPDLQAALRQIDQGRPTPPSPPAYQDFIIRLADRPTPRAILLIFGCALVVIATTCFNRPRRSHLS